MAEPDLKRLPDSPLVHLDGLGGVVGKTVACNGSGNACVYLGIPFARPPVGELRFQLPQPPEPWHAADAPRPCQSFPPRGIQRDPFVQPKWTKETTSEDCLYLNVFAPAFGPGDIIEGAKPVLVFVHGGAFVSDCTKKYGMQGICDCLVAAHDMVVVTVQYRLGYLGFFTLGDDRIADNLGLFDLTMSLQWVQQHIRQFGGDPRNVTLAGQSAGGALVELLTLSPLSRDLFHKVMPMAGNAHCMWAVSDNAVERCRRKLRKMGIKADHNPDEVVPQLRKLPAMEFATKMKFSSKEYDLRPAVEIGPRISAPFFPKPLDELRREAPLKPILLGASEHEGLVFQLLARRPSSVELIEQILAKTVPETEPGFAQRRHNLISMYLRIQKEHGLKIRELCTRVFTDVVMGAGTQAYARQQVERGNRDVFLYSFNHFNRAAMGLAKHILPFDGATHCNELVYLFRAFVVNKFSLSPADRDVIRITTRYFANFCRFGNPNGAAEADAEPEVPDWLPASAQTPTRCLLLKLAPEMSDRFMELRADEWVRPQRPSTAENAAPR